jgi:hypothetical protein
MHPAILVHLFQESSNIFLEIGICGIRHDFRVVVHKAVEIDMVLSDVIHDNHVKATRKALYGAKLGSTSFCGAKPMNVLAVLVGEFDTQTISRGVEITKEDEVVVGF